MDLNIFIPAYQIIKNPYPLWNKFWGQLLSSQGTFLLKSPSSPELPDDDLLKQVKDLFQLENYPQLTGELSQKIENAIVLDFEGRESFTEETSKVRKIGFIGFNDDFEEKIEANEFSIPDYVSNTLKITVFDQNPTYQDMTFKKISMNNTDKRSMDYFNKILPV